MSSVLVTLGDSWPQGAELKNYEKPFGYWLQQELSFKNWVNLGQGGTSNEHLVLQLQNFLVTNVHTPITAVFFLTNPARSIYWKGDMFFPSHNPELQQQFLHFHEQDQLRTAITVAALQKICSANQIDDYYLAGWVPMRTWLPGTDLDRIYQQGNTTAADWFAIDKHNGEHVVVQTNPWINLPGHHPNQEGHRLIASKLSEWIKYQQPGVENGIQ